MSTPHPRIIPSHIDLYLTPDSRLTGVLRPEPQSGLPGSPMGLSFRVWLIDVRMPDQRIEEVLSRWEASDTSIDPSSVSIPSEHVYDAWLCMGELRAGILEHHSRVVAIRRASRCDDCMHLEPYCVCG